MNSKRETLQSLLDRYRDTRGLGRLYIMGQLRTYVQAHEYRHLLEEIEAVRDTQDVKVLIGVGMRGQLYTAVVAQQARLMGLM